MHLMSVACRYCDWCKHWPHYTIVILCWGHWKLKSIYFQKKRKKVNVNKCSVYFDQTSIIDWTWSTMLKFSNLLWYLRHNVLMLSPTADGVVLHRLLCNVNSVRGQVHLGFASVYLPPTLLTLPWSCTRCPTPDSLAMLTRWEDKYTSAAPRCTCLPPC